MQQERTTSTRKNIRFNNELVALIEAAKGSTPFGTWVQDACKEKIEGNNKVTGK